MNYFDVGSVRTAFGRLAWLWALGALIPAVMVPLGSVRTENKSQCRDSSCGILTITQHSFRRSDP